MANLNYDQRIGILPLKKHVNCNKCSFTTKQRMFGVFAIDEIFCYRGSPFSVSRNLCHPVTKSLSGSIFHVNIFVFPFFLPVPHFKECVQPQYILCNCQFTTYKRFIYSDFQLVVSFQTFYMHKFHI